MVQVVKVMIFMIVLIPLNSLMSYLVLITEKRCPLSSFPLRPPMLLWSPLWPPVMLTVTHKMRVMGSQARHSLFTTPTTEITIHYWAVTLKIGVIGH